MKSFVLFFMIALPLVAQVSVNKPAGVSVTGSSKVMAMFDVSATLVALLAGVVVCTTGGLSTGALATVNCAT